MVMDEREFWMEIRRGLLTAARAIGQRYGVEESHPDLYKLAPSGNMNATTPVTFGNPKLTKNGP